MGILNLTPDSFSDGGQFLAPEDALTHAHSMVEQGAQIIDLGGESTRPGSDPVSEQEELARVLPVIECLAKEDFILSLDTTKPAVALAGLQAGVHILNDVSGWKRRDARSCLPFWSRLCDDACPGHPKNYAGRTHLRRCGRGSPGIF